MVIRVPRAVTLFHGGNAMSRSLRSRLRAGVVCAAILCPSAIYAQPGDGGFRDGPGGGFGGPFGGGGMLGLVMREEVQQELQLVDEQRDQVMDAADTARDQLREEMRDLDNQSRDLSEEERRQRFDEIRGRAEAMNADLEGKLKKVLLPHQFERLKQIDVQVRVQQRGASALSSGDLAEALSLTDEQREKLEKRAEEVRQELQEKMRQLQAEARDKMLDVLTAEQRAKLEQLMGDIFELREDPRSGGFRGDGRRGRGDGQRDNERRSRSADEAI
jgi:Spy/CpxP family protein refolding chaperone